jgi:hypothetical protein
MQLKRFIAQGYCLRSDPRILILPQERALTLRFDHST